MDDRRVLKNGIFPYLVQNEAYQKILFVGCKVYTRGYNEIFQEKDYVTLDIDPRQRRHGAKQHITDSLENLDQHFHENELDVIICNGVFGWGLNEKSAVETAIEKCHVCLRKDGILLLGWNDIPKRRPFPLEEVDNLKLFDEFTFPPFSAPRYATKTHNRHIYNFYTKSNI